MDYNNNAIQMNSRQLEIDNTDYTNITDVTGTPTVTPQDIPSISTTVSPSNAPTSEPTTQTPTTAQPTDSPTGSPSVSPSTSPTAGPTSFAEYEVIEPEEQCSYSNISVISDTWSVNGSPPNCTFPFLYKGVTYKSCITTSERPALWCQNDCFDSSRIGICDKGEGVEVDKGLSAIVIMIPVVLIILLLWKCYVKLIKGTDYYKLEDDPKVLEIPGFEMTMNKS